MEEEEPKKTRAQFERNTKYDNHDLQDKVVILRGEGKTWVEIADTIKVDIDEPKMGKEAVQTIYNRAMARTIKVEKRAGKKYKDFRKELNRMQGEAIEVLDGYINAARHVSKELIGMIEEGKIEAVKAYGIILKTAPQMKAITSEIRDYMKLQLDQQDKITIEEKALVWDESQMIDYLDKYLNKLEKEGKIRWIKPKLN